MNPTLKLNELLRYEMSAVETYKQILKSVDNHSCKAILSTSLACHQERLTELLTKVTSLGDQPAPPSAMWGSLASTAETGAEAPGEKTAIGILEEGEYNGLRQYEGLVNCDDNFVNQVAQDFLPKQRETHEKMKDLSVQSAA